MGRKPVPMSRRLAIWLGSLIMIGTLVRCYWRVPLSAILVAGGMTLLVTLVRAWLGGDRPGRPN